MKKLINRHMIFNLVLAIFGLFGCQQTREAAEIEVPRIVVDNRADYKLWKIENGKFYFDGKWKFLKIAKPLRNFAVKEECDQLVRDLDILQKKGYTNIAINCYWHHFDEDGDGVPDVSLEPLQNLINAVYLKGMYPSLSVETYSVGGGNIPAGFWKKYPDAEAINAKGEKVNDTEYGFNSRVISIFHPAYREAAHAFIKSLAKALDTKRLLYFETTVEPQYMGEVDLCYSENARQEYGKWLKVNEITDASALMPATFPMPDHFIKNEIWNKFRAQFLARWVNEDAAAYREVAGENAHIAVDFLDATENTERRRNGNPLEFLSNLTAPDILQINWHWHMADRKPNQKAYDRVKRVMKEKSRNWAVSEHMTFNGSDFVAYSESELKEVLRNTLSQGNRFGWEFVSIRNSSTDSFALYNNDWTPKKVIKIVDDNWSEWLKEIYRQP